jgi:hypothetical protein
MWVPRSTTPAILAVALPLALACGGGDSNGPGEGGDVAAGRFTAELTGAYPQTLSGQAFYFQGQEGEGFTISMSSDAAGASGTGVVLARENTSLPEVKEYAVIDGTTDPMPADDFFAASFVQSSGELIQCFSDNGGTLAITASGANLVGDFTVKAQCLDRTTGQLSATTITGNFNAVAGPTQTQ